MDFAIFHKFWRFALVRSGDFGDFRRPVQRARAWAQQEKERIDSQAHQQHRAAVAFTRRRIYSKMASPRQFRLAADAEDVHPSFQSFSRSDRSLSSSMMMDECAFTTQRLFVRASIECRVETNWGDTVVVCGSTEQLGSWKPDRALRMATDETIYPVWRCEPLLLCSDAIEFKFVILRAGGPAEWEPLPHNRPLPLSSWRRTSRSSPIGAHPPPRHLPPPPHRLLALSSAASIWAQTARSTALAARTAWAQAAALLLPCVAAPALHASPL